MSQLLEIETDSGELLNVFIESRIHEELPRLDICDDKDSKHVYVVKYHATKMFTHKWSWGWNVLLVVIEFNCFAQLIMDHENLNPISYIREEHNGTAILSCEYRILPIKHTVRIEVGNFFWGRGIDDLLFNRTPQWSFTSFSWHLRWSFTL